MGSGEETVFWFLRFEEGFGEHFGRFFMIVADDSFTASKLAYCCFGKKARTNSGLRPGVYFNKTCSCLFLRFFLLFFFVEKGAWSSAGARPSRWIP